MTGQFVTATAGHDKGRMYVIIEETAQCVFLADGRSKTASYPKKKSRKHVQPIQRLVEEPLLEKIRTGQRVMPEEIKYAIKQYQHECN